MAWTVLSTAAELKKDLPVLKTTDIGEEELEENISDAKDVIYDDFSKYIDWDEMEELDAVPRVLNRLSRYQSAMITIVRSFYSDENMIGGGEGEENTVYQHYSKLYINLKTQIETGDIIVLDADNEEIEVDVMRTPGLGRII